MSCLFSSFDTNTEIYYRKSSSHTHTHRRTLTHQPKLTHTVFSALTLSFHWAQLCHGFLFQQGAFQKRSIFSCGSARKKREEQPLYLERKPGTRCSHGSSVVIKVILHFQNEPLIIHGDKHPLTGPDATGYNLILM